MPSHQKWVRRGTDQGLRAESKEGVCVCVCVGGGGGGGGGQAPSPENQFENGANFCV